MSAVIAADATTKQTTSTAPTGKPVSARTWADIAKWPDFEGGMWAIDRSRPREPMTQPVYQPEVAQRLAAMGPIDPASLGDSYCEPVDGPFERVREFFYSKDSIFIMADEDYLSVRQIHMDSREHGDPDPSYFGHSVGYWQGDTLVVDTVGFLPQVTIAAGVPGEGATHSVERFRLLASDTLEHVITIENPKVLKQPFTRTQTLKLRRDLHVQEAFCSQNNRDLPVDGKTHVDLTPPK